MCGRLVTFTLMFSCVFAYAKDGEREVVADLERLKACQSHLLPFDFLNNRLTGEPQDPNDKDGFVTDAYPMTVDTMVRAYAKGMYASTESEVRPGHPRLVSPPERGVILLDPNDPDKGISKRDLRTIKKMRAEGYVVRFDTDFLQVLDGCRNQPRFSALNPRGYRQERGPLIEKPNWITESFMRVFMEMFVLQHAHSVAVYYANEQVMGLFGTFVDGVFTGESMYYVPGVGDNASKMALQALRRRLLMKGHGMIDTEQTVGVILDMGGTTLPREEFLRRRAEQAGLDLPF